MTRSVDDPYRHEAFFCDLPDGATDVVTGVVRAALTDQVHVVLCCGDALTEAVLGRLGGARGAVRTVPSSTVGGPTPHALAAYRELVVGELGEGTHMVLVTDGSDGVTGWDSWMRTEALLNHTMSGLPVRHLCLVDTAEAPDEVARVARQTHPLLRGDDGPQENPEYRLPAEVVGELAGRAGPDPLESGEPVVTALDVEDPRALRRHLTRTLRDGPLTPDALQDLVLALDEVMANAAEHGVPPVDVRVWAGEGRVVCAVSDRGACFDDPLAGYGPAHHGDPTRGGMGLWLARRSVDSLSAQPRPDGSGCTVRLVVSA